MDEPSKLRREISLPGAVMLGLGSIVGTGIFVSLGVAAGAAGPNVLIAILLAALVAICNGLSSAQLAAVHPVSGGTYEYGYRWLTPALGFTAGWLFVCAKSASAATAALGLAGYLQSTTGWLGALQGTSAFVAQVAVALAILLFMTVVVSVGVKRTTAINSVIVSTTMVALVVFVFVGFGPAIERASENLLGIGSFEFLRSEAENAIRPGNSSSLYGLLNATALMFVAYTGYGRIATMSEEVANPRQTIPRAMILTLGVTLILYLSVGFVAVASVGPVGLAGSTGRWAAPLLFSAESFGPPWLLKLLAIGAITALLGVVLNLLLGLSRVVLAMARREDLPSYFQRINGRGVPLPATLLVTCVIGGLICIGDVRVSWSFSAMTVLLYYALTNVCAIRVDPAERIFPVWTAWLGLVSCLSLAFFVPWPVLIAGGVVIAIGLVWSRWLKPILSRTGNR